MFSEAITEEQLNITAYTSSGVSIAGQSDRSSAIAVVTVAFATDPVARWVYPDAADYLSYFPGFIRSFAGGAFDAGTGYISDEMAGAALWLPPGVSPDEETITARFEATVDPALMPEIEDMFAQMAAFHPSEPHWYLPMIGVETQRQGNGVGSRLLRYSLDKVDEEGRPAYLESSSPRNVPLYERFGFSVMGTIKTASSPPIYPMIRRARRHSSRA